MSRRTREASMAVGVRWNKEQQLVSKGMGTRDWTPDQQQSIIETGKAYDDDGKAFEGHHMKSVEAYPEYQGDDGNIQFLTRVEHKAAHGGSFLYFTNGYYDPKTRSTKKFGGNIYEPCKEIKLSKPVILNIQADQDNANCESSSKYKTKESSSNYKAKEPSGNRDDGKIKFSIKGFLKYFVQGIVSVGLPIVADAVVSNVVEKSRSSSKVASPESSAAVDHVDHSVERNQPDERNYPDERLGPKEHDVTGYVRQQYGKTVHVNAYKRGGNKDQE